MGEETGTKHRLKTVGSGPARKAAKDLANGEWPHLAIRLAQRERSNCTEKQKHFRRMVSIENRGKELRKFLPFALGVPTKV